MRIFLLSVIGIVGYLSTGFILRQLSLSSMKSIGALALILVCLIAIVLLKFFDSLVDAKF